MFNMMCAYPSRGKKSSEEDGNDWFITTGPNNMGSLYWSEPFNYSGPPAIWSSSNNYWYSIAGTHDFGRGWTIDTIGGMNDFSQWNGGYRPTEIRVVANSGSNTHGGSLSNNSFQIINRDGIPLGGSRQFNFTDWNQDVEVIGSVVYPQGYDNSPSNPWADIFEFYLDGSFLGNGAPYIKFIGFR